MGTVTSRVSIVTTQTVLSMVLSPSATGVIAATLMALQGNWYAVAAAAWVGGSRTPIIGTLVTAGLLVSSLVNAAVSDEPSPLLVGASAAALTDWLGGV